MKSPPRCPTRVRRLALALCPLGVLVAASSAYAIVGSHRPFPQVPDLNHQILSGPKLVVITASNDDAATVTSLQNFGDALAASAMWKAVAAEYGLGTMTTSPAKAGAALTGAQTKAALQAYVKGIATAAGGPAPTGKSIYMVFLPAAASLSTAEFGTSCGEHFDYPGTATDAIAVVRRCSPEQKEETQLGQLTRDGSHFVVDAASDPRTGGFEFAKGTVTPGTTPIWSLWNGPGPELAGLCNGTRIFENVGKGAPSGGWELQRIWSNKGAAAGGDPCMPSLKDPYYSVNVANDWYGAPAGESVNIPFTGWSAAATGTWFVNRSVGYAPAGSAFSESNGTVTTTSGIGSPAGCGPRYSMKPGDTGTLKVTIPATAKTGDYAVFRITSFFEKGSLCNPEMTADFQHGWPVGVYVRPAPCAGVTKWDADAVACLHPLPITCKEAPAACCSKAGGSWSGKFCM